MCGEALPPDVRRGSDPPKHVVVNQMGWALGAGFAPQYNANDSSSATVQTQNLVAGTRLFRLLRTIQFSDQGADD